MKHKNILKIALFLLLSGQGVWGQVWTYNFGNSTGSFSSVTAITNFLPAPPSGTARVRVGTNPGSITMANPGIALGTDTELQITSNTGSSSTTKFSVYDYTASKVGYVKFKIAFNGGTNGVYNFTVGDGTTFSDNNSMTNAQIFAGLRWQLLASNAVTYEVLNNITWGATGISNSTTLFTQSTSNEYLVEVYYNNTTASADYDRSGTYSVANAKWDLWVNGTLVGNDLAKAALGTDVNIDSYAFNHQVSASAPGTIYIDDIEYSNAFTTSWSGATNTDWATAGNWSNGVPTGSTHAIIPEVANAPIISASTNAAVFDLTITEADGLVINSGGSLIVNGTSSGNVTYNRNLGTENWYLVSSPVAGETYDNAYVAANSLAINGANNAIATYLSASNTWSYMQTNGGSTFAAGTGYSVKRAIGAGAGDISFTGTINTADVSFTTVAGYNLVGNPFTSYLNGVSFINGNNANIDGGQIWVWNQANNIYDVKNLVTTIELAPAQGFFVNVTSPATVNMLESYQQSSGSAFQKSAKTEVHLSMTDGTNNRYAKMFYLDIATKGYDNGYDGETFGGIANDFDVFTNLVSDNQGKKYQIQSLPNADFETMVIPVGIISAAGKEITFSLEAMNLPEGLKVFLEDRLTNTITRLDEANTSYKVTLNDALNGTGRFYLHTKASGVLSIDDAILESVSIYTPNKSTLRIAGLTQGKATVKVFNILGKQMMETSFTTTNSQDILLPKLATGMYIVQLETATGKLNKKIVLE